MRNPYSPGAGLRPSELVGRGDQLVRFDVLRQRAVRGMNNRSIVLTGLRGVGKTVLLNEMAARARDEGWITAKVEADASGARTLREQLSAALNRSLREVTGSGRTRERVRRALATFKSFSLRADPSGALSVGIDIDAHLGRADSGALYADLTDLAFDLAVAADDLGAGVAVFIDEMQELNADELAAVCQACHESGQHNAQFYVVGAGLPSLPGVLADARSYAERLFEYSPIGALARDQAAAALVLPAEAQGVSWSDHALAHVLKHADGYPYFLQEFGKWTWDVAASSPLARVDAVSGVKFGWRNLDAGFFRSRWERATPTEREYLAAMAADGDGPSPSGEVATRTGRTASAVGPMRANLIHKGLIYAPAHGRIAFTVPGMAEFIRRQE